ncbi:hypothetical protein C482_18297 [Natrialba chahannaoensis JCM 10990]|uniref:Uncharacterized protein n=1 Tax=Natrialba chahannaoensis JCM 10990 TaxID=1227492 RepID=M0A7E9_9EURY|nr:hypothetical protein [Natrialba chahannaoensis]ELY94286.1 hypothetical protein C482_18297 [Natrialba chahannaoensis JCM 10990]
MGTSVFSHSSYWLPGCLNDLSGHPNDGDIPDASIDVDDGTESSGAAAETGEQTEPTAGGQFRV